jgi:hypothetical protein
MKKARNLFKSEWFLVAWIQYFDYYGNMQEMMVVASLAALAQPMRLRVFRELVVAGGAGLTPGVLAEHLEVPAATLSFHLIYRANFEQMNGLLGFLTENCCQGETCSPSTPCKPSRPASPSNRRAEHEALPRTRSRQ